MPDPIARPCAEPLWDPDYGRFIEAAVGMAVKYCPTRAQSIEED
jgi:hypothetical protein